MKSIFYLIIISFPFLSAELYEYAPSKSLSSSENTISKTKAFEVLKTKCNVCHQKKNKDRVFTIDNMDKNGKRIYRQVFKWKRMPKGSDIKLTKEEYSQLKNWLNSLNIGRQK